MGFFETTFLIKINIMTGLGLVFVLGLIIYYQFIAYIKINVLRYELISLSDWSANTIEQISESATEAIVSEVLLYRTNLSRADAIGYVPTDVVNAVKLWEEACDRMQASLVRNGMNPLTAADKQFLLSTHMK